MMSQQSVYHGCLCAVSACTDCPMLMQPESLVGKRAFFASKHLFVTPHDDDQLFPAGDHVVQSEDCLGLKEWTREVGVWFYNARNAVVLFISQTGMSSQPIEESTTKCLLRGISAAAIYLQPATASMQLLFLCTITLCCISLYVLTAGP
eukprot:GHUV01051764.1.p1 GENE.GHUV01051764.1~~GHUV01051764.1.p1  ORF type:complete len:149 (+),score=27.62 GHUV01051764.1:345-791(+)